VTVKISKTLTAYEDLQFAPLGEGSPVQIALLWGNPQTGPAAVLVKFPEGYQEPWHSHSSTYHAVVVRGKFRSRSREGGPQSEREFGPGSVLVQPGHETHAELNAGGGDSVAMVYFEGPIDFVLSK
jgi:quercetin dioxygenase-like cupin family protein